MIKNSKQVVFTALSVFLMALSGQFTLDIVQASSRRVSYLQAIQPNQSLTPQPATSPAAQPIVSPSIQTNQSTAWIKHHPSAGALTIVILLYLGVLGLRPRWLLLLPLDKIPKTPVNPEILIPPAIGSFLKYRPRVLDAWVNQRIAQAQEEFYQRRTVGERSIHIPIPVELDGKQPAIADFSVNDLKAIFSKRNTRLLIVGEGGVGKTSLACQIAKWAMVENKAERLCKHRMLPVLIEEELEAVEGKSPLLEAIARQIKNLRDDEKPVAEELLKQLLEKRRILVIVDHLSEMSEATRKAARLKDSSSSVNALIVTSRLEDVLGKEVTHTTLKPQRVSGRQLSIFMDAYLTQRGKRDLFDDSEYFDALSRLSQMVTDERDVPLLFAKLYADQMIAAAEGLIAVDLPNNVPDLMLSYVNEVNREKDGKLDDDIVQRDLKAIAWECLKQTFKPETAEREQVINCLTALEGEGDAAKESAKKRLKYLEERLALIRTVPPTKTKIRFALDPLAEYLAGLHLVELYGEDEQKWRSFLDEAQNKLGNLKEIRGFLVAVRDCCIAKPTEAKIPHFITEELGKLAGLDLKALEREQLNQRIRRLIASLSVPEIEDRKYAVEELGKLGKLAKVATADLCKALEDKNVQLSAAKALSRIGKGGLAVPLLIKLVDSEDKDKACICVDILGEIGSVAKPSISKLRKIIEDKNSDSKLRSRAIYAIIYVDASPKENIPLFIEALKESNKLVNTSAALALVIIGRSSVQAIIKLLKDASYLNKDNYWLPYYILGEIGTDAESAIPYLIEILSKSVDLLEGDMLKLLQRSSAARTLGVIGIRSKSVIDILQAALQDRDPHVREASKEALEKILSEEEQIL